MTVEDQLKELQRRVKALAASRDSIIRDAGIQEQKLQEAYQKLRDLGITDPEKMTDEDLTQLSEALQSKLTAAIAELMELVEEGEKLLAK
jgi:hypothetical protein